MILCANTLIAFNQIGDEDEEGDDDKGPTLLEQQENGELREVNPDDIASKGGDEFLNGS